MMNNFRSLVKLLTAVIVCFVFFTEPTFAFETLDIQSQDWVPGFQGTQNWYTSGTRTAEQGSHGQGMGDCPPGQVVIGVQYYEGGSSDWVDGIGVACGSINNPQEIISSNNWLFNGAPRTSEQGTHGQGPGLCPRGFVVTGIQYYEGGNSDWVDGIGELCYSPQTKEFLQDNWYTGGERNSEQGTHGGGTGWCPQEQVAIGVQYFEGGNADWVDGIGIHCGLISNYLGR